MNISVVHHMFTIMRHKITIEYTGLCLIILKIVFILCTKQSNASSEHTNIGKRSIQHYVSGLSPEEMEKQNSMKSIYDKMSEKERELAMKYIFEVEYKKAKDTAFQHGNNTGFQYGNNTGFQYGNNTGFQYGNNTGFKCGFQEGFKNSTESLGYSSFQCAMNSIKSTIEKINDAKFLYTFKKIKINQKVTPQNGKNRLAPNGKNGFKQNTRNTLIRKVIKVPKLKPEVETLSDFFAKTELAKINKTHDGWIHKSTVAGRKKSSKYHSQSQSKFIPEVEMMFAKCLFLLQAEDHESPPAFYSIKDLLRWYFSPLNGKYKPEDADKFKVVQYNFCAAISRSYYIANAILHMYLDPILSVPKTDDDIYFYDALLKTIPSWYFTQSDVTFLNIYRSASLNINNFKYQPIESYQIRNRLNDDVVIPLLYNSSECGLLPRDKTSPSPLGQTLFGMDYPRILKTTIEYITKPTTPQSSIRRIVYEPVTVT